MLEETPPEITSRRQPSNHAASLITARLPFPRHWPPLPLFLCQPLILDVFVHDTVALFTLVLALPNSLVGLLCSQKLYDIADRFEWEDQSSL